MNCIKTTLVLLILLNANVLFANEDYLVTKENDTIYGKIEWKTHRSVYIINDNGKQKFKAHEVSCFQRGAFRFVSIKIEFPEFLLEVINDNVSYYVEAHLKSKYAMNYVRKVYLKYKDKTYAIRVGSNQKDLPFNDPNPNTDVNMAFSNVSYTYDSTEPYRYILGEDSKLYKMIKNSNYKAIEDIEYLVELANMELENNSKLNDLLNVSLDKGFSNGYVIMNKDTMRGSMKFKGGFLSKGKLIFKNDKGEEFKYEPKELEGFGINNRIYIIEEIKKKKLILKQTIKGKISLYRDSENKKSYLRKEDSNDFVLVDKKSKYLTLFQDNKEVYSRIVKNDYNRFEIKSIVRLYNDN